MKMGSRNIFEGLVTLAYLSIFAANGTEYINIPWENVLGLGGILGLVKYNDIKTNGIAKEIITHLPRKTD